MKLNQSFSNIHIYIYIYIYCTFTCVVGSADVTVGQARAETGSG